MQQRQGVLGAGRFFHQSQRVDQALRQGMAGCCPARGKEERHVVGPKGLLQGLAVAVDIPAEDQHVVPAPAVLHGQAAAERRGEAAFLHGIPQRDGLNPLRRTPVVRGEDGKGEQLARQQGQLRRLAAGVHRQAIGAGCASGFHQDALGPDARAAGGDGQALQAALQRQEGVEIPGALVVGQRQEHMGLRAGRAYRADQPVQRGRGQVEAVEEHAGLLQKDGLGGAVHGL